MKRPYFAYALTGMGFGFPVTLLCMALAGAECASLRELAIWMLASALYGVLSGVLSASKLPLPAAVGLHLAGCMAVTLTASLLCGYLDSFAAAMGILLTAVVIYAVIYGICLAAMKRTEKRINKALEEKDQP